MQLNCDLGESYGAWKMPVEDEVMAYLNQANIACGFHAGDPVAIQHAIRLALTHGVNIGAHPSYPDLQGFGRRSMQLSKQELIACLHYQISALRGMTNIQGSDIGYVKPHGAMYNDMIRDSAIMEHVMQAIAELDPNLPLMIQATPDWQEIQARAEKMGIRLLFEAFADRRYTDAGLLTSRREAGAVLDDQQAFEQACQIINEGAVTSQHGNILPLKVDSLCVHGDSPGAVTMVKRIRAFIDQHGGGERP